MRLFGFRPKEEEAMREQVEARIRLMCEKAGKQKDSGHSELVSFIAELKREVVPGRKDRIEAVVDSIKKLIKDSDQDSPAKFYALLVAVYY
jgi:hypothetical protein